MHLDVDLGSVFFARVKPRFAVNHSGPDRIFRASIRFVLEYNLIRPEKSRRCHFLPAGEFRRNRLPVLLAETHAPDFHGAAAIDEENCRDIDQAICVRNPIALFDERFSVCGPA